MQLTIIGTLLLTGLGVVGNAAVLFAGYQRIFTNVATTPARQVAIVPGARVFSDGTPSQILADRLWSAIRLYQSGKVERIIVSGDHQAPEYDEVNAMYQFLISHGIPSEHIFLDHAGLRTLDTMVRANKVFGVTTAIICTQQFHLSRSIFLARSSGIDAIGLKSDRYRYKSHYANMLREFVARNVSVLDVFVFHTQPRHLGPAISLKQSGHVTHDAPHQL